MRKRALLVLLALVPMLASAQALPNVNSLRVSYMARKARVNPQGELKARVDSVDAAIDAALRSGQTGELRRQILRGMTLLDGQSWIPAIDYRGSLVLRSDRTVIDPAAPWSVRLEQIYHPEIALTPALTAKASIRPAPSGAQGGNAAGEAPARELATFAGVSRDLRESPLAMELDLAGVADGRYRVEVDVYDGDTSLGFARLNVVVHAGLDAHLRALESSASAVPEGLRAEVLYPVDFVRNINRGRIAIGGFNLAEQVEAAEKVLTAAKAGADPFAGRTGDMERHYTLMDANEVMPYRVYVPTAYKGAPTPLVIALHGLGATEDSFFDSYERLPPQLAEKHGFLLAAPLGFRTDGFYGSAIMGEADPAAKRRIELSEMDVLEVIRLMRTHYRVDESRIYLMGHSMGAIGTWHIGAKYPDTWAAMAAFSGVGNPASAERMKAIPQFVVHGDADGTVNVVGSRSMVAAMKRHGMNVTYIEVPGGNHNEVVVPHLAQVFEFFASHRKGAATSVPR